MPHRLILEAKRQAEKLERYVIFPGCGGFILWRFNNGWMAVHRFDTREAAEDHLLGKLPAIESEL